MSRQLDTGPVYIHSAYDPPEGESLDCAGAGEDGVSLTKQSMRDEADINVIVARYHQTGFLPEIEKLGVFGDVSELGDFRSVMDRINQVNEVFGQLPAELRARFDNDASNFIDFMGDVENGEADAVTRAKEYGLVEVVKEDAVQPPVSGPVSP